MPVMPEPPNAGADGRDAADIPADAVAELFLGMMGRTHLTAPAEVAAAVAEQATVAGGADVVLYLVDYEHVDLIPVPAIAVPGASILGWDGDGAAGADIDGRGADPALLAAAREAVPMTIQGTLGGRCFTASEVIDTAVDAADRRRLWLPLLDGTERLGVMTVTVPAPGGALTRRSVAVWERFAHLVAQLVVGKSQYGDTFEHVRRTRPMSVAAELQTALLPPVTFATRGLVISTMREPSYEGGGDAYDYAVNTGVVHLAMIDAMGHGLAASGAAAFTLAAYRRARRAGLGLAETYEDVDAALAGQFGGERYATAVFAELDLATGWVSWVNAGHPEPLLLRGGRLVKTLAAPPATPLGFGFTVGDVPLATEQLEPGDRVLLYTDGLPEARQPDGGFFGVDRLADFVERTAQDGYAAPETLRRLRHAVLQHQHGTLQDDASALLVEWRSEAEHALLPDTVTLRSPASGESGG